MGVVAGMNYRMGPLGFGTFEGFGGRIETNVGLADQREAMRWVRREIGQFGGDRERVTIFGQSAGAISVITHMASSLSRGLFHAAISQSGFPATVSNEFGLNRTRDWADRIGCNRTWSRRWCLLTKTPQELILGAQEELNPLTSAGWSPTVDGCDIQAPPSLLFEENRTADVPFLAGFNTDEANVFVYPGFPSGMPASVPPLLLGAVFSKDEAYAMSPTVLTCRTTSTLPTPSAALLMPQSLRSGRGSRPLTPISQSTTIRTARAVKAPYRSTLDLSGRTWCSTTRTTPLTACIRALPVACGPSCRMRSTGRTPVWTSYPATLC